MSALVGALCAMSLFAGALGHRLTERKPRAVLGAIVGVLIVGFSGAVTGKLIAWVVS